MPIFGAMIESFQYSDFLLTGLIALSIAQAGLFGMVSMVEMRRNGLLKRLRLTPMSMKLFGLSNRLVRFILSAIQVVLLTLLGLLLYHAKLDMPCVSDYLFRRNGILRGCRLYDRFAEQDDGQLFRHCQFD